MKEGGFYQAVKRPAYLVLLDGGCFDKTAVSGQQPSPLPANCQLALFIDANTGKMIADLNYIPNTS